MGHLSTSSRQGLEWGAVGGVLWTKRLEVSKASMQLSWKQKHTHSSLMLTDLPRNINLQPAGISDDFQ